MKRIKVFIPFAVIIFLTVFSGNVLAEMKSGTFSLSPYVGGYVFDSDQDLSNGPVYGLGVGYNYTEHLGVEGVFSYIDTESESPAGGDVKAYFYHLDGLYHFMPDKQLVPYLAVGVGAVSRDKPRGGVDTALLLNLGTGFKYFLTKSLAFRSEVRYIHSVDKGYDSNNNYTYTFGLSFLFGGKE